MNEFDREMRVRGLWRYLAVALGLASVIMLVGLAFGRPFASSEVIEIGTAGTAGPVASSAVISPLVTPSPIATSVSTAEPPTAAVPVATFSPTSAWIILTQETFAITTTWPMTEEQGWASGYEADRYWLKLNGQRTLSYSVPIDSPEFRVAVDVQVKNGRAGLLFLSQEPNIVYRFLIDDAGSYRLEQQQAADTTALRDWTASDVLRPGPEATNQIEVQRVENTITLFANDTELMSYNLADDSTPRGRAGMTIDAVTRDTEALAYFDNLVVRVPVVSAAQ